MPTYEVTLTSNATVKTAYRIEAASEEEAVEKANTGEYPCQSEEVCDPSDTYSEVRQIADDN